MWFHQEPPHGLSRIHQDPPTPSGYTSIHHGDPPRGSTRLSVQYVDTPGSIKWIHQDPSRGSTRIQHSGSKENQEWWIIAIWNFYFFPPNMIYRARTPEFIYYGNWISKSPILLKRIKFLHVFNNKHHYVCPLFILTYWWINPDIPGLTSPSYPTCWYGRRNDACLSLKFSPSLPGTRLFKLNKLERPGWSVWSLIV